MQLTQGGEMVGLGKPLGGTQSMPLATRAQTGLPARRLTVGAGSGRPMLNEYGSLPAGEGMALVSVPGGGGGGAGGGRAKLGMGWH